MQTDEKGTDVEALRRQFHMQGASDDAVLEVAKRSRASRAIFALEAASAAEGMPTRFRTDMTTHDREWITRAEGEPFAWYLYPDGTHLLASTTREHDGLVRAIDEGFSGGIWYVWDGAELRRCRDGREATSKARQAAGERA